MDVIRPSISKKKSERKELTGHKKKFRKHLRIEMRGRGNKRHLLKPKDNRDMAWLTIYK